SGGAASCGAARDGGASEGTGFGPAPNVCAMLPVSANVAMALAPAEPSWNRLFAALRPIFSDAFESADKPLRLATAVAALPRPRAAAPPSLLSLGAILCASFPAPPIKAEPPAVAANAAAPPTAAPISAPVFASLTAELTILVPLNSSLPSPRALLLTVWR